MGKQSYYGVNVGDTIRITRMNDPWEHGYSGREGKVILIDDAGQFHGTWGGLAVIPEVDGFEIIKRKEE